MHDKDFEITHTISLNHLEALKVYSPIYDTTFDLMNEEQQKHQLDVWIEDQDESLQRYIETHEDVFDKKKSIDSKKVFNDFIKKRK